MQHTFYKDYSIDVPADNYAVLQSRSFTPDVYLFLNFNDRMIQVYSPYKDKGLLSSRKMTEDEYTSVYEAFASDEVQHIPAASGRVAFDALEFGADGVIDGNSVHFYHVLPDDETVVRLYETYGNLKARKDVAD